MLGSIAELIERAGLPRCRSRNRLARLRGLPRSALGTLACPFRCRRDDHRHRCCHRLAPGGHNGDEAERSARHRRLLDIIFEGEAPRTGPNYLAETGRFLVSSRGRMIATLISEKRIFQPGNQPTTEAGIRSLPSGDLYIVMGDPAPEGGRVVRVYFNPLASCIWLGAAIMFLGGALSLTDRRFRIGAPRRRRSLSVAPAE